MTDKKERVVVVGVETAKNYRFFAETLREVSNLIDTAQGTVVFELIQKRQAVDSKTIIGKGKLAELIQIIEAGDIDLVVFNQELTPRQSQLLSEACQVKVIDRVQLILDIFAMRAQSKAGKLQVELAQLNYLLPRLTGQGAALSRLGGGIGTRGPGETKLETDRRHIRGKMTNIKNELKDVAASRERNRQQRKATGIYQIGLIGYTNAGKSTLLNLLTNAEAYSQDQLFATLDPLTKQWRFTEGFEVTLTDTVGFIQELPTQLIEAFQSTLEESRNMDLLLHVVDASSQDRDLQEQTVVNLLTELGMADVPVLTVYNKMDQVEMSEFTPTLFPNIQVSAKHENGSEQVENGIRQQLLELFVPYELEIAVNQGYQLTRLMTDTIVLEQTFDEENEIYLVSGFAPSSSKWLPIAEENIF